MPVKSFQNHDIHFRREGAAENLTDCPLSLEKFFCLIFSVQTLAWKDFGGTSGGDPSLHTTPVMQYQSELQVEAGLLARACHDPNRPRDLEEKWVSVQQSIVFYRFDREREEDFRRNRHHHCWICGKHFALRSRMFLNGYTPRSFNKKIDDIHENDSDSDVCKVHINFSNFDIQKLRFIGYDGEQTKTPDLTIGLLAWSKGSWHSPPNMDKDEMIRILGHDLVKPFRQDWLQDLETNYIKPMFSFAKPKNGCHIGRETPESLTFPFAIWEAKRALEGDPVGQNALKVKLILNWQRGIAERARVEWDPLVFHFVSMGSEWKIYACHFWKRAGSAKSKAILFRQMWSGDCRNETKALQLLYLVDLIALWGQFQYKPFAGACIRIFRQDSKGTGTRPFHTLNSRRNLLEHQKLINAQNFRSLQHNINAGVAPTALQFKLRRAGTDTPEIEVERQLNEGVKMLSLKTNFVPERDGYVWLMHERLRRSDLLVIRVNTGGAVLPPMVIFHSSNWNSEDFRELIHEEKVRMPKWIETDFQYDDKGLSVFNKCFDAQSGFCTGSEIQFCAIVPLRTKLTTNEHSPLNNHFQPLEELLDIRKLVNAAQRANKLWCVCQTLETPHMILCDAINCTVGWWHTKCAGVEDDYEPRHWYCKQCEFASNKKMSKYDTLTYETDDRDASDARIQRTRSLSRAWNSHSWPRPSDVQDLMYKTICCKIEMEPKSKKLEATVDCLEREWPTPSTRCHAVLREDPLQAANIRKRFRARRDSGMP